jgi:hypothetical protein
MNPTNTIINNDHSDSELSIDNKLERGSWNFNKCLRKSPTNINQEWFTLFVALVLRATNASQRYPFKVNENLIIS